MSDSPDGADSARDTDPLASVASRRELRRGAATRRRRRRRRLLFVTPLFGLLCWAIVSYAVYMLEPTSMRFSSSQRRKWTDFRLADNVRGFTFWKSGWELWQRSRL